MLRIRWPVFVALAVALLAPTPALADEVNALDGFTGGLSTLVNPDVEKVVENDPVRDYDYEPVLRAGEDEEAELPEAGVEIQSVINACNQVQAFGSKKYSLLDCIIRMFTLPATQWWWVTAAGIAFMWWGVRKAKIIIMAAWHGRARV